MQKKDIRFLITFVSNFQYRSDVEQITADSFGCARVFVRYFSLCERQLQGKLINNWMYLGDHVVCSARSQSFTFLSIFIKKEFSIRLRPSSLPPHIEKVIPHNVSSKIEVRTEAVDERKCSSHKSQFIRNKKNKNKHNNLSKIIGFIQSNIVYTGFSVLFCCRFCLPSH